MAGLTDVQLRKAKPTDKGYRIPDTGGLFLFVSHTGAKIWRWRYRFNGKEQTLTLGDYPDLSLSDARNARDAAKLTLKAGRNPATEKKIERLVVRQQQEQTFEVIAREWHQQQTPTWVARHAVDVLESLERDVFPVIGHLPIREIDPPLVLACLRIVEQRGAKETARRLRQRISAAFVYAISSGRATTDPAAIVKGALAPITKGRQPAVTLLAPALQMLRDIEATPASPVTKLAVRLLAITAVRPGPLAETPWSEIDAIDEGDPVWTIPAARMKLRKEHKNEEQRDHLVPLSSHALEVIRALRPLTGHGPFLFPNARHPHKPMSENAMGYLINRAGYHQRHVPHGFRSTFSTIMNETYPGDRHVIDFMLAHVPKDKTEAAYNRALYLKRRKELAQIWSDIIMEGAPPAEELLTGPRKVLNPEDYRKR